MDFTKLQDLLDDQMDWPCDYNYKFVVKTEAKHTILAHLSDHTNTERLSKNGKYTSITSTKLHHSSDDIISVYKRVSKVEGVITL